MQAVSPSTPFPSTFRSLCARKLIQRRWQGNLPFRYGKEKINIIRSIDLLVIDEISMVRADLLDSVDAVLRRSATGTNPLAACNC